MAWTVERKSSVQRDLELIFDFLVNSSLASGEAEDRAYARAEIRMANIEDAIESLGRIPFQGTRDPGLGETMRHVTKDRAIFYFTLSEMDRVLTVVAVFFGGQDHQTHIRRRLLEDE